MTLTAVWSPQVQPHPTKAPSMYEMEGASPGHCVWSARGLTARAAGRPPGPCIRSNRRFPGSSHVPGRPPVMPVSKRLIYFYYLG